jgi:hypothetical protein
MDEKHSNCGLSGNLGVEMVNKDTKYKYFSNLVRRYWLTVSCAAVCSAQKKTGFY